LQHQFEMEEVKGTLRSLIYNLFLVEKESRNVNL
jgi:hypothetical protein